MLCKSHSKFTLGVTCYVFVLLFDRPAKVRSQEATPYTRYERLCTEVPSASVSIQISARISNALKYIFATIYSTVLHAQYSHKITANASDIENIHSAIMFSIQYVTCLWYYMGRLRAFARILFICAHFPLRTLDDV